MTRLYWTFKVRLNRIRQLDLLSLIASHQGQLEEAERLGRESIAIHRKIGDRIGVAGGLGTLGQTLEQRGKFTEARSAYEEAVAITKDLGIRVSLGFRISQLATSEVHLGRYDKARTLGQTGLSLAREVNHLVGIIINLLVLCAGAVVEEEYDEAHQLAQECVVLAREAGRPYELGWALAVLGYAARGLGQLPQARQHLHAALQNGAEIGIFAPLAVALPATALLLADQGEKERAVELYALASCYPYVANSRWFEDVAGQHIAAVAATLPPDVVAAAQERGRTRDLDATVAELLTELEGQWTKERI